MGRDCFGGIDIDPDSISEDKGFNLDDRIEAIFGEGIVLGGDPIYFLFCTSGSYDLYDLIQIDRYYFNIILFFFQLSQSFSIKRRYWYFT